MAEFENNPFDSVFGSAVTDVYQDKPKLPENPFQTAVSAVNTGGYGTQYFPESSVAPFRAQDFFQQQGFDPANYAQNYAGYAAAETWGSTFGKAFDDFGYKFGNSFVEGAYSTGRLLRSIFTLGAYGINKDEDDLLKQYYADQENELKNTIFMTPEEQDSFFNKKFVKDFIGNAGYTLGTLAEIATETALTFGVGAAVSAGLKGVGLTARAATLGAGAISAESAATGLSASTKVLEGAAAVGRSAADDVARAGMTHAEAAANLSSAGRVGEFGNRVVNETFRAVGMNFADIAKAQGLYNKIWAAGENFIPVAGNLMRTGKEIAIAGANGADMLKLAGVGFNGFRRSLNEMTLATSESAFESANAYGDTYTALHNQFREQYDRVPTELEEKAIRETAMNVGGSVFDINMGILLTMNKIQFGNLFSRFGPTNKFMREMVINNAEDRILTRAVANDVKTKFYKQGFFGTFGNLGEIAEDFGKKRAAWEATKSLGRGMGKFELTEGVQELLQEGSAVGVKDYYESIYNGNPISLEESITRGARSQANQEGFKTFLIGALTGRLVAPVTYIGGKASEYGYAAVQGNLESMKVQDQKVTDAINQLNLFFDNKRNGTQHYVRNAREQAVASEQMTDAATTGNVYEFNNAKEDSLVSAVRAAMMTNSTDAFISALRQTGEQFSEAEFKEAYGIDITETGYNSVKEFTNKIADDINTYTDTYKSLVRKYGPLVDPQIFPKDSKDFRRAMYLQNALYGAIDVVAVNSIKGKQAGERSRTLANELRAISEIANSSDYALRILSNPRNLESELGIAQSELASLRASYEQTQDPALKQAIDNKVEELELLNSWKQFWLFENTIEEQELEGQEELSGDEREKNKKLPKDLQYTFIGTANKKAYQDGTLSKEEFESLIKNDTVQQLFKKIVNLKNRQAGLNTTVSDETIRQSIDKLVDYIRLDKNAKDYINAVDILLDPKNFRKAHLRFADGEFKARISDALTWLENELVLSITRKEVSERFSGQTEINPVEFMEFYMNNFERISKDVKEFIKSQDSYKKIFAVYISPNRGVEEQEYVQEELTKLIDAIKEKYNIDKEKAPDVTENQEDANQATSSSTPVNDDEDDPQTPPAASANIQSATDLDEDAAADPDELLPAQTLPKTAAEADDLSILDAYDNAELAALESPVADKKADIENKVKKLLSFTERGQISLAGEDYDLIKAVRNNPTDENIKQFLELYKSEIGKYEQAVIDEVDAELAALEEDKPVAKRRVDLTNSKIKRKDLFDGVGDFSTQLGGSDKAAVPVSHREINGIEFVEYAHPETGSIDVIVTGVSENDFVGFYRLYENGQPTNKWSSKFENQSRNKDSFKTMISGVQEMLPAGHEYTEKASISTDGLRVWAQQLNKGYQLQYGPDGKLKTNLVAINGDAIENVLGIPVNKGNFSNIRVTNEKDFETVKKALLPFVEKLGLNESNIKFLTGTVKIDLPILKYSPSAKPAEVSQEKSSVELDLFVVDLAMQSLPNSSWAEQSKFIDALRAKFNTYNRRAKNKLASIEEYVQTVSGKKAVKDLIANSQQSQTELPFSEPKIETREPSVPNIDVENLTQEKVLNFENLKNTHSELVEFKQKALQNKEKSVNFDIERDLASDINDALTCLL